MITVILGSRGKAGGNSNSNLKDFLKSLANASTHESYEVLIKLDDDDPSLDELMEVIEDAKAKGRELISPDDGTSQGFLPGQNIKYLITPRGKGYDDLHKAYLDLLRIADPSTDMYWVLSDDVLMLGASWDKYLEHAAGKFPDGMFVICPMFLADYRIQTDMQALEMCDNYPVWSAKWIAAQGGFGYTFSTDGWSNLLMRKLYQTYGIDRRVLCQNVGLTRRSGAQDFPGSERWNGIRKDTIAQMLSPQLQKLLAGQAKAIAGYLSIGDKDGQV
jgi:hypothetical protein